MSDWRKKLEDHLDSVDTSEFSWSRDANDEFEVQYLSLDDLSEEEIASFAKELEEMGLIHQVKSLHEFPGNDTIH